MYVYVKGKTISAFLESVEELRTYVKKHYGDLIHDNLTIYNDSSGNVTRMCLVDEEGKDAVDNKSIPVEIYTE